MILKNKKIYYLNYDEVREIGLVVRKLVKAPSIFFPGHPKVALLFWLFSDFRCGVPLFIVILVIYKYKNR